MASHQVPVHMYHDGQFSYENKLLARRMLQAPLMPSRRTSLTIDAVPLTHSLPSLQYLRFAQSLTYPQFCFVAELHFHVAVFVLSLYLK